MIDIIIPVYNSHETIEYTLSSIAMQNIVDKIIVYIIDDYSKKDYDEIINKFSKYINIEFFRLEKNAGPAIAREYALKKSKGNFVIFLDSDDLFKNPESVELLYNEIINDYDYVASKTYYEKDNIECYNNGDLHGKIYRRKFLIKNNIHFFDSRHHEDNAFNNLVLINNPNSKIIDDVTYIYSNNRNSITNNPLKNEFEQLEIYIQNIEKVISAAKKNGVDINFIQEYINRKKIYLEKIYNNLNKNEQKTFNKWLYEYNINEYFSF